MLLTYLILLSAFEPISRIFRRNNVCKSFKGYYYPDDSESCYFDPDTTLETPQLIEKYAGKVEIHDVTTEDGYVLTMYRVPRDTPKGVVLIHHSIATYSHIYLWQGAESLAITLWKNGFDVWLANQRGTTVSSKHTNHTTFDFDYWNFSFHEMGLYDVTSELEHIRNKTGNSKITFIGHSLGSAIGLVYASLKPKEAKEYLNTMILLAPPTYLQHSTSPILYFAKLLHVLQILTDSLRIGSPLFFLPAILPVSRIWLRLFPFIGYLVNVLVWAFCGYTPLETDPAFFNYDALIYENDFSFKTLYHFGQIIDSPQKFQMYDYGKEQNLKIYGDHIPPEYPIENITVPTMIVSSYNDSLVSVKDDEILFKRLSPEAKIHGHWKISGLNHLDYHIGLHRKEIFVTQLLEFLHSL